MRANDQADKRRAQYSVYLRVTFLSKPPARAMLRSTERISSIARAEVHPLSVFHLFLSFWVVVHAIAIFSIHEGHSTCIHMRTQIIAAKIRKINTLSVTVFFQLRPLISPPSFMNCKLLLGSKYASCESMQVSVEAWFHLIDT